MVNKDEGHKSSEHKKPSLAVSFIAAFATGAIEATMMYPFEFIKTQLQLQDKKNVRTVVIFFLNLSKFDLCPIFSDSYFPTMMDLF